MAIVNERQVAGKPTQVDPKTGKPLPSRANSPSLEAQPETTNNAGFFGSFWASKNKKKAAAMEAEMAEQKSGVIQAVREYPMAALWAFIMSCTIVRYSFLPLTLTIALMCIIDYGVLLRVPHG